MNQDRTEWYQNGVNKIEKLRRVMDAVYLGVPESRACRQEHVNKQWFRRFMEKDISTESEASATVSSLSWYCWQDKLLEDLFGTYLYACEDFEEIYEEIVAVECTEKEREFLRKRYQEDCTYRELGAAMHTSGPWAEQYHKKLLRRLRHPKYSLPLRYGREYMQILAETKDEKEKKDAEVLEAMQIQERERREYLANKRNLLEEFKQIRIETNDFLEHIPLETIGFSNRAYNALYRSGCRTAKDLLELHIAELKNTRGVGASILQEIKSLVAERFGVALQE